MTLNFDEHGVPLKPTPPDIVRICDGCGSVAPKCYCRKLGACVGSLIVIWLVAGALLVNGCGKPACDPADEPATKGQVDASSAVLADKIDALQKAVDELAKRRIIIPPIGKEPGLAGEHSVLVPKSSIFDPLTPRQLLAKGIQGAVKVAGREPIEKLFRDFAADRAAEFLDQLLDEK